MTTFESLYEKLDGATRLLDQAAGEIRDIPLEPKSANIRVIAETLSQIFDLQRQIYHHRPELIPTHLWDIRKPDGNPSPELIIRGAFRRVEIAERNGDIPLAIQLLEFLLSVQPDGSHVDRARNELARLKGRS